MNAWEVRLHDNWRKVVELVRSACERSDRKVDDVQVVAVTKYVDLETTLGMARVGCRDLAESRPQSLWEKSTASANSGIRWHLIGHLQRNKVRRTLPHLSLLQSLDSLRLLQQVESDAEALGITVDVLLEVNLTQDGSKTGASEEEARRMLDALAESPRVRVRGIMGMASLEGGSLQARKDFQSIREFRDRLRQETTLDLPVLSMGMSGDFQEAILEGSTMVRIGSLLFEGVDPKE